MSSIPARAVAAAQAVLEAGETIDATTYYVRRGMVYFTIVSAGGVRSDWATDF